jgi:hypothetical protein
VLACYGKGAIAMIDPASRTKAANIPQGFQLDEAGSQVFVNLPDAREIEVVDLASEASRSLPKQGAGSNFRIAIDRDAHRVLAVFAARRQLWHFLARTDVSSPRSRPVAMPMMCSSILGATASM